MQTEQHAYRVRWAFPVQGDPIEDATIAVDGNGIITAHPASNVRTINLGNVAVIPGLINAHTHLEFSGIREPLSAERGFADWIRSVIDWRSQRQSDPATDIARGIAESARSGTTHVCDIATDGWTPSVFSPDSPNGIVFREVIGLTEFRAQQQREIAARHLEPRDDGTHGHVVRGLSPHAPYTVRFDVVRQLIDLAVDHDAPVAMHLAESAEEIRLMHDASGPLRELLEQLGAWDSRAVPVDIRPIEYLRELSRAPQALVIHGNFLNDDELHFLAAQPNLSLVFCPRTFFHFRHKVEHPWLRLIELGGSVLIGTDGRVSNPDLSVWNELLFLHQRFPHVRPQLLLELATSRAASVLLPPLETGMISVGAIANLTFVALPDTKSPEPWSLLFSESSRVVGTMRGGRWIAMNDCIRVAIG